MRRDSHAGRRESRRLGAWCEGRGERLSVDIRLIDAPAPATGCWSSTASPAKRSASSGPGTSASALDALDAALAGETDFDRHFADLVNREPELPEHLRKELDRG